MLRGTTRSIKDLPEQVKRRLKTEMNECPWCCAVFVVELSSMSMLQISCASTQGAKHLRKQHLVGSMIKGLEVTDSHAIPTY